MRTRIKVKDLSLAQWAWLNTNLPEPQVFGPDDVRMCVELELTAEQSPVHIELPPRAFIALIEKLARVGQSPEEIWYGRSSAHADDHPEPCGYPDVIPCICPRYGRDTGYEGMTAAEVEAEAAAEMRDLAL